MRLNPGTHVKLTTSYTKWLSKTAKELDGYPQSFKPNNKLPWGEIISLADKLTEYFMIRQSYRRGIDIHGVILDINQHVGEDFAYLVWYGNELGEGTHYVSPGNLEVIL